MREFSAIGERLARLETNLQNVGALLQSKGNFADIASLEKRIDHIEKVQESLKVSQENTERMLSQYRGALVVLGLLWPFLSDWIKSVIFK